MFRLDMIAIYKPNLSFGLKAKKGGSVLKTSFINKSNKFNFW